MMKLPNCKTLPAAGSASGNSAIRRTINFSNLFAGMWQIVIAEPATLQLVADRNKSKKLRLCFDFGSN